MSILSLPLPLMFANSVRENGARVALRWREKKEWRKMTYAELDTEVGAFAAALESLGVAPGDRVVILSENGPRWVVSDLAILTLGAAVVPIYPSLTAPQIAYIVDNCGARLAIAGDSKMLKKLLAAKRDAPELKRIVALFGADSAGDGDPVDDYDALISAGRANPLANRTERVASIAPDSLASLVYTSGTTGDPKGAMLTHANFTSNASAARVFIQDHRAAVVPDDIFLSFLPLSHAFERTAGYYLPILCGSSIAYTELRTISPDMAEIKPTIMVNVPRIWDAMQDRVLEKARKAPEKRQALFFRAIEVGRRVRIARNRGESPGFFDAILAAIFDRLVYSKIRESFGGNFRILVSGGAALSPNTAGFFQAIGLDLLEGYGMTESSPVISVNPPGGARLGTVGQVLPGGEVKISPDGEICYRGPNVMPGYWNNPVATKEIIDDDGWLHTGDIGHLDDDGYIKITDRLKDIIVLANGKKVAPQPIESALKQSPFLDEIVLIGDKQSVVTALVVPNADKVAEWKATVPALASADDTAVFGSAELYKMLKSEIDSRSTALAEFEKIKKFAVLNTKFSIESGELTPTLKVKRKVVVQKYARELAALRGEGGDS